MRYHELREARSWKNYHGQHRPCLLASPQALGSADCVIIEADGEYGTISTGRTEVFFGYYVRVVASNGDEWWGEDRHSLWKALRKAAEACHSDGWTLLAIGLSPDWRESGLSENSGWGYHPAHPDRHVHMLEPTPGNDEAFPAF